MDGELTEDEMAPLGNPALPAETCCDLGLSLCVAAMDMLKAHPELIRLFNEYISYVSCQMHALRKD